MMTNSTQHLQIWASTIEPNQQYRPVDLLPGGQHAPPRASGIEIVLDPAHETVRIFRGDHGAFVKTLSPWGGEFRVVGIDVLEGLREVCRVGYPSWKCSMDERKTYLVGLLADAEAVEVSAAPPMTRLELEQFIDRDANCQRAISAFTAAVSASGRMVIDTDLRDFIQRASTDAEAAILYYRNLRDGRLGVSSAPATPGRVKRVVHPVAQEA